jgi:hypothetical protein
MNLLAHSIAEGPVDPLVTGDAARAFELGGDDGGEEMAAIALDLEVRAGKAVGNESLDLGRGGIGHAAC